MSPIECKTAEAGFICYYRVITTLSLDSIIPSPSSLRQSQSDLLRVQGETETLMKPPGVSSAATLAHGSTRRFARKARAFFGVSDFSRCVLHTENMKVAPRRRSSDSSHLPLSRARDSLRALRSSRLVKSGCSESPLLHGESEQSSTDDHQRWELTEYKYFVPK